MSYEFELNHRKTTILVGVFFALLVLVFIAGWLSGALFGIPDAGLEPATVAMPDVPPRERPAVVTVKVPPPPPEPEPAPAPVPRFAVQVGAFKEASLARNQALALREKGYEPYVLRGVNSKGETWYTVRIGDHANYDEAVSAALSFEGTEGVVPVVTYLDTLSVVRTADGSLPSTPILGKGQRLDPEAMKAAAPTAAGSQNDASAASQDAAMEEDGGEDAAAPSDAGASSEDAPKADTAGDAGEEKTGEEKVVTKPAGAGKTETEQTGAVAEASQMEAEEVMDAETVPEPSVSAPEAEAENAETGDAAGAGTRAEAETGTGRFSVQVGAFRKPDNARRLADKLREKGFGAYVFDVDDAAGKTWHAVRLDDYDDLKIALAAAQKAREDEDLPALVTRIDSLTVVAVPGGPSPASGESAATEAAAMSTYSMAAGAGRHPYSLRLASFRSREATENAMAVYRKRGLPVFSLVVKSKSGETFRLIQMGLFESYGAAEAAREKIGLSGAVIKQTPWANLAGAYKTREEAETQAERLVSAGFSPYLAEQPDGTVKVLTGAFSTRERAEAHGARLTEEGFHSAVVER